METNDQGLTKEEKIMFIILGIILLVSIGVLIINSFKSKETDLDIDKTPIKETSGQKDNIKDDSINEPEESLIEEETDSDINIIYPVVNIPSSSGTKENQSTPKPKPQPIVLDWTFKDTMITNAYSGDVITIEKNVLLSNGEEQVASIVVMKHENESWITQDISLGTLIVQEGLYKYIYSYGSSTKELLLTVNKRFSIDSISILKLNETIDETSTITIEEYNKYQTIISNTLYENIDGINYLTTNNYVDTNNLLPLLITTNEDLSNKIISTNTLGLSITKEQKDWYEEITPNSMIIWLDFNTIDETNNVINIEVDGVIYEVELNITINLYEEITDDNQGELDDNQQVENKEEINSENEGEQTLEKEEDNDNILPENKEEIENSTNEEDVDNNEEDLDPIEPTEENNIENSSNTLSSSEEQENEENLLQPEINDISEYSS